MARRPLIVYSGREYSPSLLELVAFTERLGVGDTEKSLEARQTTADHLRS